MPTTGIYTDSIRLRGKSDDSKQSGLTVALLPEGGSAPGDLVSLTQNAGTNWQYDFPALPACPNGRYTLYINGSPAADGAGGYVEVYVMRNTVKATDTDFLY